MGKSPRTPTSLFTKRGLEASKSSDELRNVHAALVVLAATLASACASEGALAHAPQVTLGDGGAPPLLLRELPSFPIDASDVVWVGTCHARACAIREPDELGELACTTEIRLGTLDGEGGGCACVEGLCAARIGAAVQIEVAAP